jgi:hypothetical protein
MRFFGAADQRSLYFLANWRKGGVHRSGVFGEFILMRVTEGAQAFSLNFKMVASPGIVLAEGSLPLNLVEDRCSAASRDRAVRHNPKLLPHFEFAAVG